MIEWDEQRLKDLVQKMGLEWMGLQWASGQFAQEFLEDGEKYSLTIYGGVAGEPFLTQVMRLNTTVWSNLGYDEADRVSVVQYLGSLDCKADYALSIASVFLQPLSVELAKALTDAVDCGKGVISVAEHQNPLTLELAKFLIDAGYDPAEQNNSGWDALVHLAAGDHPVDPQVTDLFLSAGCRTDLDGCKDIFERTCFRFDQILKEHAEWKEKQDRLLAENSPADLAVDWRW